MCSAVQSGHLELRDVPDILGDLEPPGRDSPSPSPRAAATGRAGPCPRAAAAREPVMPASIATCRAPPGEHRASGSGRHPASRRPTRVRAAQARATSMCCVDHVGGHPLGVDAAQPQHLHGRLLAGCCGRDGARRASRARPGARRTAANMAVTIGSGWARSRAIGSAGSMSTSAGDRLGVRVAPAAR